MGYVDENLEFDVENLIDIYLKIESEPIFSTLDDFEEMVSYTAYLWAEDADENVKRVGMIQYAHVPAIRGYKNMIDIMDEYSNDDVDAYRALFGKNSRIKPAIFKKLEGPYTGEYVYVKQVIIEEEFRGLGLGSEGLDVFMRYLASLKIGLVVLQAEPIFSASKVFESEEQEEEECRIARKKLKALYRKHGFKSFGRDGFMVANTAQIKNKINEAFAKSLGMII